MRSIKDRDGNVLYRSEEDVPCKTVVKSAAAQGVSLRRVSLAGAPLQGVSLEGADLAGADLNGADLRGAELTDAVLAGADLRAACFDNAEMARADCRHADARAATFVGAWLCGTRFWDSFLQRADFTNAYISRVDFRSAHLEAAVLVSTRMDGASFADAHLLGADFTDARIDVAALLQANWGDVSNGLCRDLMRLDASAHPDSSAFDRWADGGPCPYEGDWKIERLCLFRERRDCWSPGPPPRIWSLLCRLLDSAGCRWDYDAEGRKRTLC